MSSNKAWVTLATNDSYSLGALVLAHSLKAVKTVHKLAILITPGVTTPMKLQIEAVFDDVKVVDVLDSKDQSHLALMCRPELGVTFTKLHCWTFTNYEKCVFLDADTLVLQNCDELFEREELSAAPDPGWPDCFNSGVFVYKPSQDTFSELLEFARTRGSFDGGDQGLLNMFFKEWSNTDISKHLSFTYNVVWSSTYSYLPALKQFGQNMKIIHFIASSKPWLQSFNTETRLVTATCGGAGLQALLQLWWDLFCHHVHPMLSTEMIESRLSSRYSYDFHHQIPSNSNMSNNYSLNYTPTSPSNYILNNYYTTTYNPPKEDHYSFVDPWEVYLSSNKQKHCEVEKENDYVSQVQNSGDENVNEVCLGSHCEGVVENNYYINNCDTGEETRDYSFQNNIIEECNTFENETKKNEHFEELREYNELKQEKIPKMNENCPACSDDIPINPNSNLNINNCRPESPTHCEVPKDQTHYSNGGLAGQFARISLDQKTADQKALEDFIRRQSWEQGNMDYLGKDSFSNIWAKINETLGTTPEVKIESDAGKTTSPPKVVHTEEPKPLKSALKKTSTTIPPIATELIDNNELPVKQLEKLDLSKDILKEVKTPETPTITSPTPPTTPATQAQESPKPESVISVIETTNTEVSTKESSESAEKESPKPEAVVPKDETSKIVESTKESTIIQEPPILETVKPKEETPKLDTSTEKLDQNLPKAESFVPKLDEPVKEVSTKITPKPQTSIDSSAPLVTSDPPVPPKRTNKGPSNTLKSSKPEK